MYVYPMEAVRDLAAAFGYPIHAGSLDFRLWTQIWSDTSLGFGGLAGQGFTGSTVIAMWKLGELENSQVWVFVGGKLAYVVKPDDPRREKFMASMVEYQVPGRCDWQRGCSHVLEKNSNVCQFCGRAQRF